MAEIDDSADELAKIDQIVALMEKDQAEPAPEQAAPAQESEEAVEGQPPAADEDAAPAPEEADSGEEVQAEQDEPDIEPPASWDAEAKAEFAKLSTSAQRKIAERERERDRALSIKGQESAESKKALERAEQERLRYDARLKELEDAALGDPIIQWGDKADWVKLAAEVDPQTYNQYQATYSQRKQALARVQNERAELHRQAQTVAVTEAQKELKEQLGDEFTNDAKWRPLVDDVVAYLRERKVPREHWSGLEDRNIRNATEFMVLVDLVKARRQLKAKDTLPSKKVAPQVRPAAKPRAVQPAPQAPKPLQAKINRARQTGKDADAIAAIEAAILNG